LGARIANASGKRRPYRPDTERVFGAKSPRLDGKITTEDVRAAAR
jgi:hypothetical protein